MKYAVLFFLALAGCAGQVTTKPQPTLPKLKQVDDKWLAYESIAKEMLERHGQNLLKADPKDIKEWCPNFSSLDRIDFYSQFLSAMAKRESGYDPKQEYKENFKNHKGEVVISTGLLQVSYSSCGSYGVATTTKGLHDPRTNIECGVRILDRWVPKDGYLAGRPGKNLGGGRYWAVLRTTSGSFEKIRGYLQGVCKW